ncbi:NlpC/P60 family protein [bacterium]|nr:NlpC/P60 family protein [bacterium]
MSFQDQIVRTTQSWVGTPYRHQASAKQVGADCLGLVRGVWREVLGPEPKKTPPYGRRFRNRSEADLLVAVAQKHFLPARAEPEIGHLLLFRMRPDLPVRHCALLVSMDRFIHALERRGVVETEFDALWRRRLHSFYQFPEGA